MVNLGVRVQAAAWSSAACTVSLLRNSTPSISCLSRPVGANDARQTWRARKLLPAPFRVTGSPWSCRSAGARWRRRSRSGSRVTGRSGPPSATLRDLRSCVLKDVLMDVACGASGCGQRYWLGGSGGAGRRMTSCRSCARPLRLRHKLPWRRGGGTCRAVSSNNAGRPIATATTAGSPSAGAMTEWS